MAAADYTVSGKWPRGYQPVLLKEIYAFLGGGLPAKPGLTGFLYGRYH